MAHPSRVDILLVEDSAHERELTLRALKRGEASSVVAVEDGSQALDFLFARGDYSRRHGEAAPRLVLLDLMLPKVSGLEILRQIRANDETKMVPVVMLTSSQEKRDIADSYEAGVNSYIVKEVDFEEFVRCVSMIREYWLTCNRLPR
ncbi:MAG TPA: response regulator [Vicinamibacteria bacterium]|nr:response regulator [Vicinamibacteria bacterium]